MGKLGSAGMAGLNMETRLEDDFGKPVTDIGAPGEICGKGPHAMIMYFKEPEKTEAAMKGGWFHSGDIGVLDEDRYVSVVDRKKDMIKTGGENVSTREVEEVVYLDKRVEEVAVIGVEHAKWVESGHGRGGAPGRRNHRRGRNHEPVQGKPGAVQNAQKGDHRGRPA